MHVNPHFELSRQRAFAHIDDHSAIIALQEFIADLEEDPSTREHPALEMTRQRLGDESIRTGFTGNIMNLFQTSQVTFGSQDLMDYHFMWP